MALALALCLGVTMARTAWAQGDEAAQRLTRQALDKIRYRKYGEAALLLDQATKTCRKSGCTSATKASIYGAQAVAYALDGKDDKARVRFEWALAEDPNAKPDPGYSTRKVRSAFDAAQKNVTAGKGAPPPRPVGELSAEQKALLASAKQLYEAKQYEECFGLMVTADFAAGKLLSARCQDKIGLMLEAKNEAGAALQLAEADDDTALVKESQGYLESLDAEIPKIKLELEAGVRDVVVKIDGKVIAKAKVGEPIEHNPGTAIIEATGKRGGQPYEVKQRVRFARNETIEVELRSDKTPLQVCYEKARNRTERAECDRLFKTEQGLSVKAGIEVFSYNDNDHVDVLSPSIYAEAVQPTDGWNVAGTATVDVVSSASADIVATASRRFDEARFRGNLGGGYQLGGLVTAGVAGDVSIESDYIGRTIGLSASADVADKMVTPYVGYSLGFDIIGRADTDFAVFSRTFYRHAISFGSSIIFNATTLGVVAATVQIEDGDSSKPYRHVAMFSGDAVDDVPRGAAPQLVGALRLPLVPLEQLPDSRYRYALLLRGAHRFDKATLRGSERIYSDSWGQWASTTDARFLWDFYAPGEKAGLEEYPRLRLGPHARVHIQGGVDFWRRVYVASPGADGYVLPAFRTGDRELGPLLSVTAGSGVRAALTPVVSISAQVEGVYTQFFDHLYVYDRWGIWSATTLELELQ